MMVRATSPTWIPACAGMTGRRIGSRGFTLLELMVVVVIIGILVTFTTLTVGNRALDDRLEVEAQRLDRLLRLAAEEAEIKGIDLGLRITTEGYEFLVHNPTDGTWSIYEREVTLRPRDLGDPFALELRLEGRAVPPDSAVADPEKPVKPQVRVFSSGEVDAFALALRARGLEGFYLLQSDALGRFKLEWQART